MTGEKDEDFERRLAAVEQAVAEIQRRLAETGEPDNWLEQVIGSMSDVEAFEEALRYGREFRHADRPPVKMTRGREGGAVERGS